MKRPPNYDKVFHVFRKHYVEVPLETFKSPYKIFVSTLLSSRTNDDTTLKVSKRLFSIAPTIEKLNQITEEKLANLLYPVNYYRAKAKNLKLASSIILNKHKGKIPSEKSKLLELPGVGIKTANLVINRAFGEPAISVDTHVHKITNILGWLNTKSPEKTLIQLEKTLPNKYWSEINRLFVSIGRQHKTKNRLVEFLKKNRLI